MSRCSSVGRPGRLAVPPPGVVGPARRYGRLARRSCMLCVWQVRMKRRTFVGALGSAAVFARSLGRRAQTGPRPAAPRRRRACRAVGFLPSASPVSAVAFNGELLRRGALAGWLRQRARTSASRNAGCSATKRSPRLPRSSVAKGVVRPSRPPATSPWCARGQGGSLARPFPSCSPSGATWSTSGLS